MKNTRLFLSRHKLDESVKKPHFNQVLNIINNYFIGQDLTNGYDEENPNLFKWYLKSNKKLFASVIAAGLISKFKEAFGLESNDFYVTRGSKAARIDIYQGSDEVYEIHIYLNLKPEGETPNIEVEISEVL